MRTHRLSPLFCSMILVPAFAVGGCDAAATIAGDAMQGEARNLVAAQCQQVAGGAGIVSGRIAEVCACTAETLVTGGSVVPTDITRERVETIVNDCAKRTSTADSAARTEETGG